MASIDILDILEDLNIQYEGSSIIFKSFDKVVEEGIKSTHFKKLVSVLTNELALFYNLDDCIQSIDESNVEAFQFELSGFLQEYGCPYDSLKSGNINERLSTKLDCQKLLCMIFLLFFLDNFFILFLVYLATELQAAKMYFSSNPNRLNLKNTQDNSDHEDTSKCYEYLNSIRISLNMQEPPANIPVDSYLHFLKKKLSEMIPPSTKANAPIIKKPLTTSQWKQLEIFHKTLTQKYTARREMLLKRLDVTIASFNWSERAKKFFEEIASKYQSKRHQMRVESGVKMADLLAAREDLAYMSKTSSGETLHKCKINKVKMGKVPDRGGRVNEMSAPPPGMPSWQNRKNTGYNQSKGGRGYNNQSQGGRGYNNQSQGGRGYSNQSQGRGQSRWNRGGSHYSDGHFDRVFSGGQQGRGGFSSGGRYNYTS